MLTGLMVAAAFQATPASQPRFVARQSSTAHSDLQALRWGSVVLGWRALRPPRVVFVIGVASLINSLTSGKNPCSFLYCNKFSHFSQKQKN